MTSFNTKTVLTKEMVIILDIATRSIPFVNHNDCIRVQMGATQIKQAVPIIKADAPSIRTGFEEQYLEYSSFLYKAKDDGEVIYYDPYLLICKYDSISGGEIIDLGGETANQEGFDRRIRAVVKYGRFKKDTILAKHSSINSDGFLTLGRNLLTTFISCPYNFRDAIVVSESAAKKLAIHYTYEESINCTSVIPILWHNGEISYPQGTEIKKAQTIFVVKDRIPQDAGHLVTVGQEIQAPISGKLYYKIGVNEIINTKDEAEYYNSIYLKEIDRQQKINTAIKSLVDDNDNVKSHCINNAYAQYYTPQLKKKRTSKSDGIEITFWIVQNKPLLVGSKLSNRHGNKGVIGKIYEDKDMPKVLVNPNIKGSREEIADVIVNPLSIPSRMNVGQLYELHLTRANQNYVRKTRSDKTLSPEDRSDRYQKMIHEVQPNYINDILDNHLTNDKAKRRFTRRVERSYTHVAEMVHPAFTEYNYQKALDFCIKYGEMDTSLKENVIFGGEEIQASIGYNYWYRLEHEPDKKYFARSVGTYSMIGQPGKSANAKNRTGTAHRVGELETWALLAHQAYENILELFVSKSDCISEAARMLKYIYDGKAQQYTPFNQVPGILKVFKAYINAAGYDMIEVADEAAENLIESITDTLDSLPEESIEN